MDKFKFTHNIGTSSNLPIMECIPGMPGCNDEGQIENPYKVDSASLYNNLIVEEIMYLRYQGLPKTSRVRQFGLFLMSPFTSY